MHRIIRTTLMLAGIVFAAGAFVACSSNPQTPAGKISQGATEFGHGVAGEASDTTITTKVKAKMAANTGLSSFHIHVTTVNGVVTLSGTVDTTATRDLAEHVAANTGGVVRVVNDLRVGSD